MSDALPTRAEFQRRMMGLSYTYSALALAVLIPCLYTLLGLTGAQWRWFLGAAVAYTLVVTLPQTVWHKRTLGSIPEYLDGIARGGDVDPGLVRTAFHDVIELPRRSGGFSGVAWVMPVVAISIAMELRFPHWGVEETAQVMLSGLAAGLVSGLFVGFRAKRLADPIRNALALALPDVDERARLVRSVSLYQKLVISVSATAIVPVIFAVLLFQDRASRSVEQVVTGWQQDVLERALGEAGEADLEAAAARAAGDTTLARALRTAVADLATGDGPLESDVAEELRGQLADGLRQGDSTGLPSESVFAWRRLSGSQVALAMLPEASLHSDAAGMWWIFVGLLVSAGVAGVLLAYLLAGDVSRATEWLRSEAERLASGDLSRGRVFESEDELGELSRSFESMSRSLRETVGRVAEAADRVEATAMEMVGVSTDVASVTADQVSGIRQTTTSMEAINEQVRGIADSAQGLNVSVEESSSSVLELGAAGEELNETASVLSERVNEVSSSIEQMVRSVKQVLENTEALAEAAVETSASMGEMATSMREVDSTAEETGRLSRQVVESAESGQAKMVQTIEGMDAIREATETAERVIRSLGGRASEIGAIVDVIDDVADETNLLALNAAIIAAQAGEHGRAFSVVADEIKDLADRVLASTKEIGGLIRAVQQESTNAIGAIEKGTSSVALGVDLTAEAGASLEEITRASRESGQRIAAIVSAVREQARAASHVVELMERVRTGVEEIRSAAAEQDRGNEVVHRGAVAMRDVASQVRGTTEEQARGSGRIRESVEGVREAVEQINSALQEQSASCRSAVEFLEAVHARTRANESSSQRLDQVAKDLVHQAEALRQDVRRFRV